MIKRRRSVYPDGAIRSEKELIDFTKGKEGELYEVTNGVYWGRPEQSMMTIHRFTTESHIKEIGIIATKVFITGCHRSRPAFYLDDMSITQRHLGNDHFIFTDKEQAKAYLIDARNGWCHSIGEHERTRGAFA